MSGVRLEELHAYLDGELDATRTQAVEAWLEAEPDGRAALQAYRDQGAALHGAFDGVLSEALPARLLPHAHVRAWPGRMAAASLGLALGTLLGWTLRDAREPVRSPMLPRQAAVAHAVFVPEIRHPVEVSAKEEAHLVRWLSKRLGTAVRAPRLSAHGFELLGGRLLPESARPGAQFTVSPGYNSDLLKAADDSPVPVMLGASTASEVMTLMDCGYTIQKFFPAEPAGGVAYL